MRSGLLKLISVVGFVYALALLLIPEASLSWVGITLPVAGIVVVRLLGAAFLTIAGTLWGGMVKADHFLLWAGLGSVVSFIVALLAQTSNIVNSWGWIIVAFYGLLTLCFAAMYMNLIKE